MPCHGRSASRDSTQEILASIQSYRLKIGMTSSRRVSSTSTGIHHTDIQYSLYIFLCALCMKGKMMMMKYTATSVVSRLVVIATLLFSLAYAQDSDGAS